MRNNFISQQGIAVEYPAKLTRDREKLESQLVGALLNDISLVSMCDGVTEEKFMEDYNAVLFSVVKALHDKGVSEITSNSVDAVLGDVLKQRFIEYNGMSALRKLQKITESKNFDIYLEEFKTSETSLSIFRMSYNTVMALSVMSPFLILFLNRSYLNFFFRVLTSNSSIKSSS